MLSNLKMLGAVTLGDVRMVVPGTNVQVAVRVIEVDATTYRFAPVLGMPMSAVARKGTLSCHLDPLRAWQPNFVLEVGVGRTAVRRGEVSKLPQDFRFAFSLNPNAADNSVSHHVYQW
ncbi:MAG: hypothetical protein ACI89X_004159 [Planctomycetota bacterium]|jgi:hypothetical protein